MDNDTAGFLKQIDGKRVAGELDLGRRWRFLATGTIRVGPDEHGDAAVDLIMGPLFRGRDLKIVRLQPSEWRRLVASTGSDCDYEYDGVLSLGRRPAAG